MAFVFITTVICPGTYQASSGFWKDLRWTLNGTGKLSLQI
jgi:hypothetical protein